MDDEVLMQLKCDPVGEVTISFARPGIQKADSATITEDPRFNYWLYACPRWEQLRADIWALVQGARRELERED